MSNSEYRDWGCILIIICILFILAPGFFIACLINIFFTLTPKYVWGISIVGSLVVLYLCNKAADGDGGFISYLKVSGSTALCMLILFLFLDNDNFMTRTAAISFAPIGHQATVMADAKSKEDVPVRDDINVSFKGSVGNSSDNSLDAELSISNSGGNFSYVLKKKKIKRNLKLASYNRVNGGLRIEAYAEDGSYIGVFEGVYEKGVYQGSFTNINDKQTIFKFEEPAPNPSDL